MAHVKEISVDMTYTKNMGNYESLKLGAGVVVTLSSGENVKDAYASAWETAENEIKARLAKVAAKNGCKP